MENKIIQTKKLKLAQIRYFDAKHNGVAVPHDKAYVFLLQVGDKIVNILNPLEELPVYGRVPYANTTRDGEDYGTKIALKYGEVKSGPCYVEENLGMDNIFGEEEIPMEQVRDFVLASNLFFMDRVDLIREKLEKRGENHMSARQALHLHGKLRDDVVKRIEFKEYLETCALEEQQTK